MVAVFLIAGGVQTVKAHMSTTGYSDIYVSGNKINYQLYLEPSEVSQWVDTRSKKVFVIESPSTVKKAESQVQAWKEQEILPLIKESLVVKNNEVAAEPSIKEISIRKRQDVSYAFINLQYEFPNKIDQFKINYNFFFDGLDPLHQNFSTIHAGEAKSDVVFTKNNRLASDKVKTLESNKVTAEISLPGWLMTMFEYVVLGLEHIWTGYDHLLFVAALILLKQRIGSYVKIVTAFTLGHSITIALAALDVVSLPASIVEPLIALSIVYVAVENIWIKHLQWRWALALGFGLIHGFGFAQVLEGSLGDRYLLSLFSFNLGVELGQIAVLAVLLPILILASRIKWYKSAVYGVSGLIAAMGMYWLVERTLL
jgi:hydrogenase/urease accessory protein HupE